MERKAKFHPTLLKGILIVGLVTLTCVTIAFLVYDRWTFDRRRQEKQLTRTLQRDPRIESIEIVSFEDGLGLYKIESVSFAIKGKPGSRITLLRPDTELKPPFWLCEIGNLRPHIEKVSKETGSTTYGVPTFGESRNDGIPPGVDIGTIGDLVTHYDEMHAYFSQWPVLPRVINVQSTEEWTLYGSQRR
jgi:hypothetical protein